MLHRKLVNVEDVGGDVLVPVFQGFIRVPVDVAAKLKAHERRGKALTLSGAKRTCWFLNSGLGRKADSKTGWL